MKNMLTFDCIRVERRKGGCRGNAKGRDEQEG